MEMGKSNSLMKCKQRRNIYIKSPKMLTQMRDHYSCPELNQLVLENEGGIGTFSSHFEKYIFGNELMCGAIEFSPRFSKISLALMEDSGWYKVDYQKADLFEFGRGTGCGIFKMKCDLENFRELCQKSSLKEVKVRKVKGCDSGKIYRAVCDKETLANECRFFKPRRYDRCLLQQEDSFNFEIFGTESRCIDTEALIRKKDNPETTELQSIGICTEIKCSNTGKSYRIRLINPKTKEKFGVKCNKKGLKIKLNKRLTLLCDDPKDICPQKCNQNCYERGMCLEDGTCRCDEYFEGENCEKFLGCDSLKNPKLCDLIKKQYLVSKDEESQLKIKSVSDLENKNSKNRLKIGRFSTKPKFFLQFGKRLVKLKFNPIGRLSTSNRLIINSKKEKLKEETITPSLIGKKNQKILENNVQKIIKKPIQINNRREIKIPKKFNQAKKKDSKTSKNLVSSLINIPSHAEILEIEKRKMQNKQKNQRSVDTNQTRNNERRPRRNINSFVSSQSRTNFGTVSSSSSTSFSPGKLFAFTESESRKNKVFPSWNSFF